MMKKLPIVCALLWISPAFADDDEHETKESVGEISEHGGHFSLLGRECKAEEETLETSPGSPPLDVDDTGSPGCNAWEIDIVTTGEFGKGMSAETPLLDINYGVGDNYEVNAELPYEFSRVDGVNTTGLGRAAFSIKYRFYDHEESETGIAFYPGVEFAIPGTAAAEGDEGKGTTTKLPLLFTRKIAETRKGNVMVSANAGFNVSTVPGTEHFISGALGIGFPVTSKLAMMIEGSTEQALSKNADGIRERYIKANLGFIGPISEHLAWFGAVGQTFASSDMEDSSHTCVTLGLRVLAGGP
jgi:hypothetical protein